jgi:hypothetical protein
MYTFPEGPKTNHKLYLRSDLATETISAARFREDMFVLYRRFLAQSVSEQRQIVVRNLKEGFDMFLVVPLDPLGKQQAEDFLRPVLSEVQLWRDSRAHANSL